MRISQRAARFVIPATWGTPPPMPAQRRRLPSGAAQLDFFALIDGAAAGDRGSAATGGAPPGAPAPPPLGARPAPRR